METKKCSKCGETKSVTEFYKRKNSKDGYRSHCKYCTTDSTKKYRDANKERYLNIQKEYSKENREKIIEYQKNYRENYPDRVKVSRKKHYEINKLKYQNIRKLRYVCNKEHELSKRNEVFNSTAKFKFYVDKLTKDEMPKLASDGVSLEVKCRYCGKYFIPTNKEVQIRIRSLNNIDKGDGYFYCSNNCKLACPVYGQIKHIKGFKKATSREVQPQLRQMVLARDNYTCQKCDKSTEEAELHCHHILPLNESPIESADMDNCITLCKSCHKEVHKQQDCKYHELRCSE